MASLETCLCRQIISSSWSSGGAIKAGIVTGIAESVDERKINLNEAVCIPFSGDRFAEGTFIFLGHCITYPVEWKIQLEEEKKSIAENSACRCCISLCMSRSLGVVAQCSATRAQFSLAPHPYIGT